MKRIQWILPVSIAACTGALCAGLLVHLYDKHASGTPTPIVKTSKPFPYIDQWLLVHPNYAHEYTATTPLFTQDELKDYMAIHGQEFVNAKFEFVLAHINQPATSGPWSTMPPDKYDHRSPEQVAKDNQSLEDQDEWLAKNRPKEWLAHHPDVR